jgi:hypothetical protein
VPRPESSSPPPPVVGYSNDLRNERPVDFFNGPVIIFGPQSLYDWIWPGKSNRSAWVLSNGEAVSSGYLTSQPDQLIGLLPG